MYKLIILLSLILLTNQQSFAQNNPEKELSKETKKKIKSELKTYLSDPAKYLKEQEEKQTRIKVAEKELETIKSGLRIEKRDLEYARDSVGILASQLEELKKQAKSMDTSKAKKGGADCSDMPEKGTFYKVQLGNFSAFTPSGFDGSKSMNVEVSPSATKRFIAGYFKSLEEATKFAEDFKRLGIKGAFVGQYKDGKRNESFNPNKPL